MEVRHHLAMAQHVELQNALQGGHPLKQLLKAQHGHTRTEITTGKQGWAQEGGVRTLCKEGTGGGSLHSSFLFPFLNVLCILPNADSLLLPIQ